MAGHIFEAIVVLYADEELKNPLSREFYLKGEYIEDLVIDIERNSKLPDYMEDELKKRNETVNECWIGFFKFDSVTKQGKECRDKFRFSR